MAHSLILLTSADWRNILKLKLKIERYERELVGIYEHAQRHPRTPTDGKGRRGSQPALRALITGILRKAKEPLTMAQIYEASLMAGYHWRSKEPINALSVKMYTDKTFNKVAPGVFALRGR